jgi:alkylation response protein AidB-like acyl-CoA dehydrogenase
MDFQFSEDQRAFADMAQGLFADFCSDEQLRKHDVSSAPFMHDLWQQCVAAGLHTMILSETDGGLGLGMTELLAVLEQQGRALALVPLWEQQVAAAALARFAPQASTDALAQALAGQPLALSLAALSASRGAALQVRGGQLHGLAPAVALAGQAPFALLAADDAGSLRLALVDLSQPALRLETGLSQHHLGLADVVCDGATVLALLPMEATAWVEQRAIAALAALQLGVTQQQLRRTVEYVSERKQFDRVIGSFQLVAGQMADGYIAQEALRTSLSQLVYRLDAGLGCVPQALATRTLSNDTGHRVGHMAQHVHGGIGVDLTYPMHRFLYWSRALGSTLGGTEQHLERLGNWLADNDTLGWKYDLAEN